MNIFLNTANEKLNLISDQALKTNGFFLFLDQGVADKKLYALFLIQYFHLLKHFSKSQALTVERIKNSTTLDVLYQKFCLESSLELTGGEVRVLKDLNNLGIGAFTEESLPNPLSETQDLIDYLYEVSMDGNPYQRLGMNYWILEAVEIFQPVIFRFINDLNLKRNMMSSLIEYDLYNEKSHARALKIMNLTMNDEKNQDAFLIVMEESLKMTSSMLSAIYHQYSTMFSDELLKDKNREFLLSI